MRVSVCISESYRKIVTVNMNEPTTVRVPRKAIELKRWRVSLFRNEPEARIVTVLWSESPGLIVTDHSNESKG